MPPFRLTPIVKWIALINIVVFFITSLIEQTFGIDSTKILGMHDISSPLFEPWQIITHIFMHGNLTHLFSNMFALIIYGPMIESQWGGKKFLQYYLFTALGAVALHGGISYVETNKLTKVYEQYITNPNEETFLSFAESSSSAHHSLSFTKDEKELDAEEFAIAWHKEPLNEQYKEVASQAINNFYTARRDIATVGASGAVFGLIIAFGILFSEVMLYLYFLFPIKAKYIVLLHGGLEIYSAYQNNPGDNVAHFAHIGGMIFGYILIKFWQHKNKSIY
jgi:membrane associated rhomboid family serine protease